MRSWAVLLLRVLLTLVAAVAHFHNAELLLEDNVPHGLKAVLRFPHGALRTTPVKNAAE